MATTPITTTAPDTPVGDYGINARVVDGNLVLTIPLDRTRGRTSASGKMLLTASSGGFTSIPGTDGLKLNLSAGFAAAK